MAKKVAKKSVKSAAKKSPAKKTAKPGKSKIKVAKRNVTKGGKASKPAAKAAPRAKAPAKAAAKAAPKAQVKAQTKARPAKVAKAPAGRGPVKAAAPVQNTRGPQRKAPPMEPKSENDVRAGLADAEQAPQSGVTLSQAKLVTPEKSAAFAVEVARMLRDDKCEDVVCLDVRGRSPVTDYLVIGSGTSDRQMRSVLQHVEDYGAQTGNQCVRRSIDERATWILADFVDVVVHLFEPNTRAHYDLEMLWGDSKRVAWERPDQVSRDYAGLNN